MAKQDDWVRLTVRMPPSLYERLQAIVASGPLSMNAEIVDRLEASLIEPPRHGQSDLLTPEGLEAMRECAADTSRMLREMKDALSKIEAHALTVVEERDARERTKPKPD